MGKNCGEGVHRKYLGKSGRDPCGWEASDAFVF